MIGGVANQAPGAAIESGTAREYRSRLGASLAPPAGRRRARDSTAVRIRLVRVDLRLDLKRYPPAGRIRDWLAAAGFVDIDTRVAPHIVAAMDAELALSQGRLDASTTSQLAILTNEEYERGISRIRERIAAEKAAGSSLELRADLRLYTSYGRVAGA